MVYAFFFIYVYFTFKANINFSALYAISCSLAQFCFIVLNSLCDDFPTWDYITQANRLASLKSSSKFLIRRFCRGLINSEWISNQFNRIASLLLMKLLPSIYSGITNFSGGIPGIDLKDFGFILYR